MQKKQTSVIFSLFVYQPLFGYRGFAIFQNAVGLHPQNKAQ